NALQEENLGLEVTAISRYLNRWQEEHLKYTSHDGMMKNWVLPFVLNAEDIDYLWSLIKGTMPVPPGTPYNGVAWTSGGFGKDIEKVMPTIQKERPELLPKLKRMSLPSTEIYAEITKISKPV
ncbi:MAG: hypothetical protein V3S84_02350, partial [Dehalococcoidales bacterium]